MKKLTSTFLALCLTTNLTANALINETYKVTHDIGHGTTFTQLAGLNNSSPQMVNIIEYTPNTNVSPVVVYNNRVYNSKLTITQARDLIENEKVIAGVNGDFYTISTGVPNGLMITNGEMICSDSWQYAIGFNENGEAFIGKPATHIAFIAESGTSTISYYNKVRTTAGLYLLDENFYSDTISSRSGFDIILEELDDEPMKINGTKKLKVIDIIETSSPTALKEGQMVLTVREEISDKLPDVSIGEEITIRTSTSDLRWADATFAIGGYQLLIKDSVIESGLSTSVDPRTVIGIKADGTVVVYQVDGRQQGYSTGLSLSDIAKELLAMGCVDALNLDGGGSSATIASLPGDDLAVIQNSPSDGSLRSNANYLMFVNNSVEIGEAENLHIYTNEELALVNSDIEITVKATDENYYPVDVSSSNVLITINDENLIGNVFSPDESGNVSLKAMMLGGATGNKTIKVLDTISSVNVKNSSGTSISSLLVKASTQTQLHVSANYNYIDVASTNKSFDYKIEGEIGFIDENGLFTATGNQSTGKIIISYLGKQYAEISVTVGMATEEELYVIDANTFESYDSTLKYYDVTNKIIPQTGVSSNSDSDSTLTVQPIDISDYKYINLTVYGDHEKVYATFLDNLNEKYLVPLLVYENSNVASANIPANAEKFLGFETQNNGNTSFENISFSTIPNSLNVPQINVTAETSANVVTLNGNISSNGNFSIDKSNISITLNGEIKTFSYDDFSGAISANISGLSEGLNRIKILVTDNFGNINAWYYDAVSTIEATNIFVDTDDNWAKDYINYNQTLGVVNGIVEGEKTYFKPTLNITRAEFAVMIYRFLDLDIPNSYRLFEDDYDIASWAKDAVYAVNSYGYMQGSINEFGTYSFKPTDNITRAEVFTVLSRIIPTGNQTFLSTYLDEDLIPSWSLESFAILDTYEIINGFTDNTIRPLNNITRSEVCKLLYSIK